MRYYDFHESPYGQMLLVASDGGVCGVYFRGQKYYPRVESPLRREKDQPLLRQVKSQLSEYFGGERRRFEFALAPEGTAFQLAVWKAISGVPFGETISYAELAQRAGQPGHARAAGAATGRNPIGIIIPCHRIVGANGSLTGYAAGLETKRALLAFESRVPELFAAV